MAPTIEIPIEAASDFADLGRWVATVLALGVLSLIAGGSLLERTRRDSGAAATMLFLGLTVLPVFMMLFGAFAGVEQAKSVQFCDSCHTAMHPYVADMLDPESDTLAAVHATERYIAQNPCYRCHANYGVWGEADAKIRGFAHLYHWLVGSPTALGQAPIRTYRPYDNGLCLECHAGGKSFLASGRGVHRTIAANLIETEEDGAPVTSCLVCHGPAHRGAAREETDPAGPEVSG